MANKWKKSERIPIYKNDPKIDNELNAMNSFILFINRIEDLKERKKAAVRGLEFLWDKYQKMEIPLN